MTVRAASLAARAKPLFCLVEIPDAPAMHHAPFALATPDAAAVRRALQAQGTAVSEVRLHSDELRFTCWDVDGHPIGLVEQRKP